MININIKKLHKDAVIPKITTIGAACKDVVATEIITDSLNNRFVTVKLGFSTEIPEGYKMCIAPRSSFTQKGWIMQNSPAQIDSDYRGEWMIKFEGLVVPIKTIPSIKKFPYKIGDRVAQIWLERVEEFQFKEVQELSNTERGEGGFGSTGDK